MTLGPLSARARQLEKATYLTDFGRLNYDDPAAAVANAAIIARAWTYMASRGGTLHYPEGVTIYVDDHDDDGYVLLHHFSNVKHVGKATVLQNVNPYKPLLRIGPAVLVGQDNGMFHTWNNTFQGLIFDQGLDLQKIKNPSGEFGNADGWQGVGGGEISSYVDARARRLRLVVSGGSLQGAAYAMQTVPGQSYYASIQLSQAAPAHAYICASATVALSGSLSPLTQLSTITDPLLRHSFEFTATGTTTYFLIRQNSGGVTGTVDFKHAYCWPQLEETAYNAQCVSISGMRDTTFRDCIFRNSGHYLVGMQNGGHVNNTFEACTFEDNLMDGLDCKNNGSIQRGNVISACRFLRNSLKSNVGGGSSVQLDLSEGWSLSDLYFEGIGCNVGFGGLLRFKTGEAGDGSGRGEGGRRNTASNIRGEIVGVPIPTSVGFFAQNRLNLVSNLILRGAYTGAYIQGQGTHIMGGEILDAVVGAHLLNKGAGATSPADVGRDSSLHGVLIRARDRGIIGQVTNASLHGVSVESDNIGLEMLAGTITWEGGKVEAPTPVSGAGGLYHLDGVYGYNNFTQRWSAAQSVAAAGVYDLVFAHGLPFTPTMSALTAGVLNTDAQCQAAIYLITSTTITVRLRVFTAGTGNATVYAQYLNQRQAVA